MGGSEWTEFSVNMQEGVLVSVVCGEAGIRKPTKSDLDRIIDEGESLNAPNKDIKSSSLAMVRLK